MPLSEPRDEVFWQQVGLELYFALEALKQRDLAVARERLHLALEWLEEIEGVEEMR